MLLKEYSVKNNHEVVCCWWKTALKETVKNGLGVDQLTETRVGHIKILFNKHQVLKVRGVRRCVQM